MTQEEVARHLAINAKTLRGHFGEGLDGGQIEANTAVARSLFRLPATGHMEPRQSAHVHHRPTTVDRW